MLLFAVVFTLQAQTESEKISREFTFEKKGSNNTFMIANINGDIIVEGYEGDKVLVEVTKTIKAKTQARLEKGKQELSIGIIDRADTIILFIDGLCNKFGRYNKNWKGRHASGWSYNWNDCNDNGDWHRDEVYDYEFDFKVKVPSSINVSVSTVNNGVVSVVKVAGSVKANNVNGAISLRNLSSGVDAYTVNGDVDLDFDQNPSVDCRFYTLNGDINALFKRGLAANIGFKSFNGELFSNVSELDPLPVALEKKESTKGVKYQVNGNRFRVGKGGAFLDFETFNGDVYVKEKNN
jgi:hypothetical protein